MKRGEKYLWSFKKKKKNREKTPSENLENCDCKSLGGDPPAPILISDLQQVK